MDIELAAGETLIKEGAANHFKGSEAVGGKLYLTNTRLIFKSHAFNVQAHEEAFQLGDITSVLPRKTLGIIPNGMTVTLKDGREEKFVINGRDDWMKQIAGAKAGTRQ